MRIGRFICDLLQRNVWRHPADTPVEALIRGHARGLRFARFTLFLMLLGVTSLVEMFLAGPGLLRNVALWVALVSTLTSLPLFVIMLVAALLIRDLERELALRGKAVPRGQQIDRLVGWSAMKYAAYFILLLAIVNLGRAH